VKVPDALDVMYCEDTANAVQVIVCCKKVGIIQITVDFCLCERSYTSAQYEGLVFDCNPVRMVSNRVFSCGKRAV